MEWQDQGISSDLEDRRGSSGGGFGFGGGMGIGGFILLLVLSLITGRNSSFQGEDLGRRMISRGRRMGRCSSPRQRIAMCA